MLRNYLIIAWRNLLRNPLYSFLNVAGLAVGMAVATLIGLWTYDEVSANRQYAHFATLYQVRMYQTFDGFRYAQEGLPYPMGDELRTKYPDFAAVAMCDWGSNRSLAVGDRKLIKTGYFIGAQAIRMFSLAVLRGDPNPLRDPYAIVLTDETARALFGAIEVVGKTVRVDNHFDLKVTAVVAKQPANSSLTFDYLLPWQLQQSIYPWLKNEGTNWGNNSYRVFAQLRADADPARTGAAIKGVVARHFPDNPVLQKTIRPEVILHPMAKWRLYADFENGANTGGFIRYVRLFGLLGMLVLTVACINFMNLSTARSERRAKEVGIRKAIGSGRRQLVGQFLSESLLVAVLALGLALGVAALTLPAFNTLTDKAMALPLLHPLFWATMLAFTLLTGLLAGSYPAFYLSSFNAARVLKGGKTSGKGAALPRKVLVVTQFVCSIALTIGTLIIYQQIRHGRDRPVGFNTQGLLTVEVSESLTKNYAPLRNDLLASGAVQAICTSNSAPWDINSRNSNWTWPGMQPDDRNAIFATIATGYGYCQTLGIKPVAGRDFSDRFASDSLGVLLNEAAVRRMGLKNPVGTALSWGDKKLRVVGVVPDMRMDSPFQPVAPLTVVFNPEWANYLCVRLAPTLSASEALRRVQPLFDRYNPGFPFDYQFADVQYAKKFNYEKLVGNLAAISSALTVFISCLGLFGLAAFTAERRTKEIGIRKVLGADVLSLWRLLSGEFVKLVLVAFIIAVPIAWYAMNQWLQDFAYRVDISWWVFALAGVLALLIALLTVSYQAIKAALANPVKSLRSE